MVATTTASCVIGYGSQGDVHKIVFDSLIVSVMRRDFVPFLVFVRILVGRERLVRVLDSRSVLEIDMLLSDVPDSVPLHAETFAVTDEFATAEMPKNAFRTSFLVMQR